QRLGLAEVSEIRQKVSQGRMQEDAFMGVLLDEQERPGGQRFQVPEGFGIGPLLLEGAASLEGEFDQATAQAIVRETGTGSNDGLDHAVDAGILRFTSRREQPERL